MKKSLILSVMIVFCVATATAQKDKPLQPPVLPIDSTTKMITYKEVVTQQGSSAELYKRAMDWIVLNYKNTAEVVKTSNEATGVIEGSSRIKIHTPAKDGVTTIAGIVNYNFVIEAKDGRYRYTFTRFSLKDAAYNPIEKWFDTKLPTWFPQRFEHLKEVNDDMVKTINSLKESMAPKVQKSDNW